MSEPAVELIEVTKRYGPEGRTAAAVDNLSASFARGAFVSIMGASGSGKTTILNLMAGLDAPDTGTVVLNGQHLRSMNDRQLSAMRLRNLGFVFQAFHLIPVLTVEENIAWPLEFAGHARAEVRRRTADALARVGLRNCERRHPAQLSGGEQQRVAIARAIAPGPSILLADEPTGNLDSHTGQDILDLLRALNRDAGVTVVMVTHSAFAATYGHRTLEVEDGRIVRDAQSLASTGTGTRR